MSMSIGILLIDDVARAICNRASAVQTTRCDARDCKYAMRVGLCCAYGLFSGYRLRYAFRYALMRMPFRYAQYGTLRYRASCLQSPLAPVRQRLTRSMMSCNTYMTKARKAYDTLSHVCGKTFAGAMTPYRVRATGLRKFDEAFPQTRGRRSQGR